MGVSVSEMMIEIVMVSVIVIVNLWNSCLMMLFISSSGMNIVISDIEIEMMVKLILFVFLRVVFSGDMFFLMQW